MRANRKQPHHGGAQVNYAAFFLKDLLHVCVLLWLLITVYVPGSYKCACESERVANLLGETVKAIVPLT